MTNKILKYNDFINENLRDKMKGVSEEDIQSILKNLNAFDKIDKIKKYNLSNEFLPSKEDMLNDLKKLNAFDKIDNINKYNLSKDLLPSKEEIKDALKTIDDYKLKEILSDCIEENNIDFVKYIIDDTGFDINASITTNNSTPLMVSSKNNQNDVFDFLISKDDIIIDKQNNNKETALFFACGGGILYKVKKLVEMGANVYNESVSNKLPIDIVYEFQKYGDEYENTDFNGVIKYLEGKMKKGD